MSRLSFGVTALAILLAGTFALAQQAGQTSGQQQWQSGQARGAGGSAESSDAMTLQERTRMAAERVATIAQKENIDLYKAVQAAEQQAKGKAVAAVLIQPRGMATGGSSGQTGGTSGQGGSAAQGNLTAHVAVATQNQLQFVAVDPKTDKVITTQNRPFISNLWAPEGGAGGSAGQSGTEGQTSSAGQGGSAAQGQTGTPGQTETNQPGATGGTTGQQGLTTSRAQMLYRLAEQDNAELYKAIQAAESNTHGKAVAAFLTMHSQAGMGGSTGRTGAGTSSQQNLVAHVFTVENNQIKMAIVDAKTNKVLNVENRQMLNSPWEGRMGAGGSTGEMTPSGQPEPGSGLEQPTGPGAPGRQSSPQFPTGSGEGSGPGTLGG